MDEEEYSREEVWQAETWDYTHRLFDAAETSPLFAGAEMRHETRELVIYSLGDPDEATAAIIREAPSNVRVTWREAPYTEAELTAEVHRLASSEPCEVNSIGTCTDGTSIWCWTTDKELLTAADPQTMLGARYPVSVEYGEQAAPI